MKFITSAILVSLSIIFISCERPTEVSADDGLPPAVPVGLRFYSATDGEIIIEWNRNFEKDLRGYNVYRRNGNENDFTLIDFTNNDYYIDDSLDYNTVYFYKISAVDLSGKESNTTEPISAKPVNRRYPLRPRFVNINARNWEGRKSVFINWESSNESDVIGYNIFRGVDSEFSADSISLTGFSPLPFFEDTIELQLYQKYYYKIKAVDKGGLQSSESPVVSDWIFDIPEIIFPGDNQTHPVFDNFIIKAIEEPAVYKILVQTNQFFGEFWSKQISSSVVNDTIKIAFTPPYLEAGKKYFWRVITYSGASSEPNSISTLQSFTISP